MKITNGASKIETRRVMQGSIKKAGISFLFFLGLASVSAFSPLEEGEKLLMENKPREALPFLEQALNADPSEEKIYVYLGIAYEQVSENEKAIGVMQRGLDIAKKHRHLLYFNIGNNFFSQGENLLAADMYTKAIGADSGFAEPYLNRANARLVLEEYRGALNDYTVYLRLKPATEQRFEIERMIELLKAYLDQLEREEQEKADQEKALMNEVLNLLKNASEDAQNLSAGSEGIVEEEIEEIDIED
jgi:tetratricopeptide (TPR) repeat protein